MAFTDETLDKWKYALKNIWSLRVDREETEALLARLEAAEYALTMREKCYCKVGNECCCGYDVWRKAAGKGNS